MRGIDWIFLALIFLLLSDLVRLSNQIKELMKIKEAFYLYIDNTREGFDKILKMIDEIENDNAKRSSRPGR